MPRNNKGKNAFYFFMTDWKIEQEKLGKSYPDGLRDVQRDPELTEDWNNLSHERKAYYQSRAKDSKIEAQGSMVKRTAIGETMKDVTVQIKKQQEIHQNMLDYIESVIAMGKKHNCLDKLKFMFIHVNTFYRRAVGINRYEYCPAEFAVAEFSLDNGVENVYHEIISMPIPLGWRWEALEMSKETHKIPVEHPDGQTDFVYMYKRLVKLLDSNKTGTKYPPLFTVKDMTPVVLSLLEQMCKEAQGNVGDFLIYSLEALFGGLRNAAAENVDGGCIPLVVAEDEFGKDFFGFVSGLECEFHRISDASLHCSMSIVKRWGYTICDHCCEYMDIPMIDGIHRPMPQANFNYTRLGTLDLDMSKLSITSSSKTLSMCGVGSDYREKVSERTHEDEQRRRNQYKELEIIDHGKNSGSNVVIPGRPLRLPKTVPKAVSNAKENDFDNFPVLGGRDIPVKRNDINDNDFPPLGRGWGKYVKK